MRKNAKRRSFGKRFFDACLTGVSRMALAAGDLVARNPVVAGGATAFLVVMGFVASNAIWYQPQAHDGVFFKTRPEQVYHPAQRDDALNQRLTGNSVPDVRVITPATGQNQTQAQAKAAPATSGTTHNAAPAVAVLPDSTVDGGDLPALAPNGDKQVAILQYNLKQLGFYDGTVDGLTGPQTRKALEQWQAVQVQLAPAITNNAVQHPPTQATTTGVAGIIAVAVPEERPVAAAPRPTIDADRVSAPIQVRAQPVSAPVRAENTRFEPARIEPSRVAPVSAAMREPAGHAISAEELVRIQAGLKAFGNDMVVVDGVPGKTTEDAIREFQKLFRLNVSGKPDPELIGKMREIGLIS